MINTNSVIIIGRVLQGIGVAGAMPIVLPLVGDLYKDDSEDFLNGSYIIAGVLGAILTFIVFKFINVDEIEESNEVT